MSKKSFGICVCILFVISAFTVVSATNSEKTKFTIEKNSGQPEGVTLITECHYERVIEVDNNYNIIWEKTGLEEPVDSERLENGNTLIADSGNLRIIEVDIDGNIVWEYNCSHSPIDVERLDNGNTLITYMSGEHMVEVNSEGIVVWWILLIGIQTMDAERLENGNTLIATLFDVREVDYNGDIVWQITGLNIPEDVERLENGNTLITEWENNRVIEIDSNGDIVWEFTNLDNLSDAERLENGNTLIADLNGHRVIEVDSDGDIVWEYQVGAPWDVERVTSCVNHPPDTPTIDGPTSGKPGIDYDYTFVSTDPDGDDIYYHLSWGDKEIIYIYGPFPSGEELTLSYNWTNKGTYTITCWARDIYDAVSDVSTLKVTIPRTRASSYLWYQWFLERFPILERLLGLIRVK